MDVRAGTLLVASLALGVACLSLGWQIAVFLMSTGRAKATMMFGVVAGNGAITGPVTKTGAPPMRAEQLVAQGITGTPVVGIKVTNHGRAPLTVEKVEVCTRGGGATFTPIGDCIGPDLPHRLEPGTNATWLTPADAAARLTRANREALGVQTQGVFMRAALGTGKTVETPETLRG